MRDISYLISDYKHLFCGFSLNKTHREKGSSGGIGTEISSFLLKNRLVDKVIGVGFSKKHPFVPVYKTVGDPDEVIELSGSKYTFMSLAPLKERIRSERQNRLAVFLQPCFVKAVRRMQKGKYPNIRFVLSFFCGYNVTREATDYLIKKARVDKKSIEKISYRWGPYPGGFMVKTQKGRIIHFGKECYELVDLMFLRNGCKKCSLYMGEGADIVLGDAWIRSFPNSSIVMTRTNKGTDIIRKMEMEKQIKLFKIKEEDLIRMHWHNLKYKKYGMGLFLNLLHHILRSQVMKKIAPFKLFMFLSRIRRKLALGIHMQLEEK